MDSDGVLNASFRLSADGGYSLTLSDASGALLDRLFVPEQYTGISYARMTDGNFLYTVESTPNQQNSAREVTAAPPRPRHPCPAASTTRATPSPWN